MRKHTAARCTDLGNLLLYGTNSSLHSELWNISHTIYVFSIFYTTSESPVHTRTISTFLVSEIHFYKSTFLLSDFYFFMWIFATLDVILAVFPDGFVLTVSRSCHAKSLLYFHLNTVVSLFTLQGFPCYF